MKLTWIALVFAFALGAHANCDHPFYPVKEGWVWTYSSSLGQMGGYTLSTKDVSAKGFLQKMDFGKFNLETRWTCNARGLARPEYSQPSFGQAMKMDLKTISASGVVIPNALGVGTAWNYSYEVEGTITQQKMTMQMKQKVNVTNKVLGRENVSVKAGKYSAFKVQTTMQLAGEMKVGGQSVPTNTTIESTTWYAQGVGMVKSVSKEATVELVSLKK